MTKTRPTFMRLDGLACEIIAWGWKFALVRFCGPKGKKIRRDSFMIPKSSLDEF